jgi:hypothetical protein
MCLVIMGGHHDFTMLLQTFRVHNKSWELGPHLYCVSFYFLVCFWLLWSMLKVVFVCFLLWWRLVKVFFIKFYEIHVSFLHSLFFPYGVCCYLTLRLVSSLNNPQNSEMKICENMSHSNNGESILLGEGVQGLFVLVWIKILNFFLQNFQLINVGSNIR